MIITETIEICRKDQPYEVLIVLGRIPFDPIFTKAMVQGQKKRSKRSGGRSLIFWKYKNIKQLCVIRRNKKSDLKIRGRRLEIDRKMFKLKHLGEFRQDSPSCGLVHWFAAVSPSSAVPLERKLRGVSI